MTKECMVSVRNEQIILDGNVKDVIEIKEPGTFYEKAGHYYVVYDEEDKDLNQSVKNILKFSDNFLELMKSGHISSHMVFQKGASHSFYYRTPYGEFAITVHTEEYSISENEKSISIVVKYNMEMDQLPYAICEIEIQIESVST